MKTRANFSRILENFEKNQILNYKSAKNRLVDEVGQNRKNSISLCNLGPNVNSANFFSFFPNSAEFCENRQYRSPPSFFGLPVF